MNKFDVLLGQIDVQYEYLISLRALFPYMDDSMVGQAVFRTPAFYQLNNCDVSIDFGRILEEEDIKKINLLGHWINQNYIIRLVSLLESYKIIPSKGNGEIDQGTPAGECLDIARRLRNIFAHTDGRYNFRCLEEKKLYERVVTFFNITSAKNLLEATEYPISIDILIKPLTEGCKEYIKINFLKTDV